MRKSIAMAAGAVALVLTTGPIAAQAPFYQGKQIKVLVGFTPGGGTDLFGRIIAEGLARSVEGKPSVVVQNMPGAGSVVASNYYVQKAPRDGSFVLVGTGQLLMGSCSASMDRRRRCRSSWRWSRARWGA